MTEPDEQPNTPADTPAAPQPPVPPASAPSTPLPLPPFAGQPYPPGYAAQPFAPVLKEPWFNPAKRTTILVTSIVLALLLLGGGFIVGAVATHHRDHGRGVSVYGPLLNRGQFAPGVGQRQRPGGQLNGPANRQRQPAPNAPNAPSPTGSTS
jgi:hypothetical protein